MLVLLLLSFLKVHAADVDDGGIKPACARAEEALGDPKYIGQNVSYATAFLESVPPNTLEILIQRPTEPGVYDFRPYRLRLLIDSKNRLVSARCG